jgi:hypothetical protein
MGTYTYEARDPEGRIIKGTVEAKSEEAIRNMLHDMDFVPTCIIPVKNRPRAIHYVGTNAEGERRDGTIQAENSEDAHEKLRELGINPRILSSVTKNLDLSSDDTLADKIAKGISKPLLFLIFAATGLFMMTLPDYLLATWLTDSHSRVVEARVIKHKRSQFQLEYESRGRKYLRWVRGTEAARPLPAVGESFPVRHSVRFPGISLPASTPIPKKRPAAPFAGMALVGMILLLFYASVFHYIARIRGAWALGKPAPPNDFKRLRTNAAAAIMLPLTSACIIGSIMGNDPTSLYSSLWWYFSGLSIALLLAALYLKRKSPVYFD